MLLTARLKSFSLSNVLSIFYPHLRDLPVTISSSLTLFAKPSILCSLKFSLFSTFSLTLVAPQLSTFQFINILQLCSICATYQENITSLLNTLLFCHLGITIALLSMTAMTTLAHQLTPNTFSHCFIWWGTLCFNYGSQFLFFICATWHLAT